MLKILHVFFLLCSPDPHNILHPNLQIGFQDMADHTFFFYSVSILSCRLEYFNFLEIDHTNVSRLFENSISAFELN